METPSLLVIFHDDLIENYVVLDEHGRWEALHHAFNRKTFDEKPKKEVLKYYEDHKANNDFYELQLKFYIIR